MARSMRPHRSTRRFRNRNDVGWFQPMSHGRIDRRQLAGDEMPAHDRNPLGPQFVQERSRLGAALDLAQTGRDATLLERLEERVLHEEARTKMSIRGIVPSLERKTMVV